MSLKPQASSLKPISSLKPLRLVLLGTGGSYANDRRQTACLMLPEAGVVLDAGTALYRAARWVSTPRLDIYLSHAHLDHVVGLSSLYDLVRVEPLERVIVHGDEAKLRGVEEHLFAEPLFPVRPSCEFQPLEAEEPLAGGGHLSHFPLDHPGGSIGFRLDWPGHSLAYVTDTTAAVDAPYVEKIRGVDLLVHECFLPDEAADWAAVTGHSTTTPVGEVARRAQVGRLILVHLDPRSADDDPAQLATARAIFPATDWGVDGLVVEF